MNSSRRVCNRAIRCDTARILRRKGSSKNKHALCCTMARADKIWRPYFPCWRRMDDVIEWPCSTHVVVHGAWPNTSMPTMISFTGHPIDNKSQIRRVTCSSGRGPSRKRCNFSDAFPPTRFHGARSTSLSLDAMCPRWINTACEDSCPNSRGVTLLAEATTLVTHLGDRAHNLFVRA